MLFCVREFCVCLGVDEYAVYVLLVASMQMWGTTGFSTDLHRSYHTSQDFMSTITVGSYWKMKREKEPNRWYCQKRSKEHIRKKRRTLNVSKYTDREGQHCTPLWPPRSRVVNCKTLKREWGETQYQGDLRPSGFAVVTAPVVLVPVEEVFATVLCAIALFFFLQTHLLDCLSYIQHGGETVRIYHDLQVLNLCMHVFFGRKRRTYVRTDLIPWTALRAALRSLPFRVVHSRLHEVMEERTRQGKAARTRESKHNQLLSPVLVGNNLWFYFLWYVIHSKLSMNVLELTSINPQSSH